MNGLLVEFLVKSYKGIILHPNIKTISMDSLRIASPRKSFKLYNLYFSVGRSPKYLASKLESFRF